MVQHPLYLTRRLMASAAIVALLLPAILAPAKAQDAPQPTPETELPTAEPEPTDSPEEPQIPEGAAGASPGEIGDEDPTEPLEEETTSPMTEDPDDLSAEENPDEVTEESATIESPRALW